MERRTIVREGKPEVVLRTYKPYSKERIPGVHPEGNLNVGHRHFGEFSGWHGSACQRLYNRYKDQI